MINNTKIQCLIHVKRDHPNIYNANEEVFSQFSHCDDRIDNDKESADNSVTNDLDTLLQLIAEEERKENAINENANPKKREDNLKSCVNCPARLSHKLYVGVRGLKIHHGKMHKDIEFSYFEGDCILDDSSTESIKNRLGHLNKYVKIIKRIPKGARITAANELSKIIDSCVSENNLNSWEN